jgi:hypothetical protein
MHVSAVIAIDFTYAMHLSIIMVKFYCSTDLFLSLQLEKKQPQVVISPPPPPAAYLAAIAARRRRSKIVTVCNILIALSVVAIGVIGGIALYSHLAKKVGISLPFFFPQFHFFLSVSRLSLVSVGFDIMTINSMKAMLNVSMAAIASSTVNSRRE